MHLSHITKRCWLAGLTITLLFLAPTAWAHNPVTSEGDARWVGIINLLLLVGFWGLYVVGQIQRPVVRWRSALFHATTVLALLTLLGPLDDWAKTSTAAHMVQHMALMVVIAPLWVISRPLPQIAGSLGRTGQWLWRPLLQLTRFPLTTAYLHAAAIWVWHVPTFYMLVVENPWWHLIEHACFLLTAGLFWWAVLRASPRRRPFALLAVLFTLMHTGFLGAVLTFADSVLYDEARGIADQQLAGLIMWVVGALPYLGAAGWVGYLWMQQLQKRMQST